MQDIGEMAEYDVKKVYNQGIRKFDDVKIENLKFHKSKEIINLIDKDMEQILKSDELTYGKFKETNAKYFIGMKKIGIKISDILYFIGTKSTIKNMLEKYELFYNKINRIIGNQFDI